MWTSKLSYMQHKLFDNDLVAIREIKVRLTLDKTAYVGICILELSKVLSMDSIMIKLKVNMTTTQNHYSQTLIF